MDARMVESQLNIYGAINLPPREKIKASFIVYYITGVILLPLGIIATIAAFITTRDTSRLLRIIGPCFEVIGVLIIAISRCCLKKLYAENDKGDVMLSVETQQRVSYTVPKDG